MTPRRRTYRDELAWGLETVGPVCQDHLVMVIILNDVAREGYLPWSREARHCVMSAFEVRNTEPELVGPVRKTTRPDKREKSCP